MTLGGSPVAPQAAGHLGPRLGETVVHVAEPVLGTTLELRVTAAHGIDAAPLAEAALAAVLTEVDRLEPLFSVHDAASELCRWRAGSVPDDELHPEIAGLLAVAARWFGRGHGTFNPGTGRLAELWRTAEVEGRPPPDSTLTALVAAIAALPYAVMPPGSPADPSIEHPSSAPRSRVWRTGDCTGIDLNAIAKGYIVDRSTAVAAATDARIVQVVVNIGGDLRHHGLGTVLVGIEDPHAPHDNVPPLVVIALQGAALATSGRARRGYAVGGRWYGHVIDPRTGCPVEQVASVSVVAPDATTADVLATIIGVLGPDEGLAFAERTAIDGRADPRGSDVGRTDVGIAALVVDAGGVLHRSAAWRRLEGLSEGR